MRPSAFGLSAFGIAAIALAMTGCGSPQQQAPQPTAQQQNSAQQNSVPAAQPTQSSASGGTIVDPPGDTHTPIIIPVPEVPTVAPPIEGSPQTRQPYVYSPGASAPSGQYGLGLNRGPVTGYGPGGLAQPPGAPSNPPFHYAP